MKRLQKFVEYRSESDKLGRVAYSNGSLFSFNPTAELLKNSGLEDVFLVAIVDRCAVIKAKSIWGQ